MLEKSRIEEKKEEEVKRENKKELNDSFLDSILKKMKKKYKYIKGYTKYIFENKKKIITIGDIHGDYQCLLESLKLGNIIDKKINYYSNLDDIKWIAKKDTIVIQIGDLIDMKVRFKNTNMKERGDNLRIFRLLYKLQKEALLKNGKLICLLGNHEIENVLGNFKYTSDSEFYEFYKEYGKIYKDDDPKNKLGYMARKILFSRGNLIAKHFANNFCVIVIVNNWLFVHGGIDLETIENYNFVDMNEIYKKWLNSDEDNIKYNEDMNNLFFKSNSILKNRELSKLKNNKKNLKYFQDILESIKKYNNIDIKGIVIGHTPQFTNKKGINSEFNNKLWKIDVGMSSAFNNNDKKEDIYRVTQVLQIDNNDDCIILKAGPVTAAAGAPPSP